MKLRQYNNKIPDHSAAKFAAIQKNEKLQILESVNPCMSTCAVWQVQLDKYANLRPGLTIRSETINIIYKMLLTLTMTGCNTFSDWSPSVRSN
jgi:hypothetical protein